MKNKPKSKSLWIGFFAVLLALLAFQFYRPSKELPQEETAFARESEPSVRFPSSAKSATAEPVSPPVALTPPPTETSPDQLPKKPTREEVEQLRSVVKSSLAAAFVSQKAYWAEYSRYSTDFTATGLTPSNKEMKIKFGFISEFRPETDNDSGFPEQPERMNTDTLEGQPFEGTADVYTYTPEAKSIDLHAFRSACRNGCTADEDSFEMIAVIPIDETRQDVWLINDKKEFLHVQDGLSESTSQ